MKDVKIDHFILNWGTEYAFCNYCKMILKSIFISTSRNNWSDIIYVTTQFYVKGQIKLISCFPRTKL